MRDDLHALSGDAAADRLRILALASNDFSGTNDLYELIDLITRRISEIVGEACAVRVLHREGETVSFDRDVTATYHPNPEIRAIAKELAAMQPFKLGVGLSGRVAETGKGEFVPLLDAEKILRDTPPAFHEMLRTFAVTSLLAVPLRVRGRILGVVSLSRTDGMPAFTEDDLTFTQQLADRAALSLENALLVNELEKRVVARTAELEKANHELRSLQNSLATLVDRRTKELQDANAALRKSEVRFRRLSESGIVGVVVSDIEGKITDANDAFLNIVGYSRDDLLAGKVTGQALNTPEREITDAAAFVQLEATGVAKPWEKELFRKDGTRVPVLSGAVLLERDGSKDSLALILDLTERKQAEAALRASEARRASVMETSLDAVYLVDHEGTIIDCNAAAERTFGYAPAEVLGKPLADMLHTTHSLAISAFVDAGATGPLGSRVETSAARKNGDVFEAELAIARIQADGSPMFTVSVRDISERRQAAQAEILRREKEAAQAANAELEAFSYSVAHDLRAPLRGINGFSNAVLEDYADVLDDAGKALLLRVTAATKRMSELIDSLLALARLSRTEVRSEHLDLTQIARGVVERLRVAEPNRAIEIAIEEGMSVVGDPSLLRVVLENLIGNAWKFTRVKTNARIEIGVTKSDNGHTYFVRDNGAGFDMDHSKKLFVPFQRLHTVDQFEGSGIGLATVERIIRRHGGHVWADAKKNEGATFQFTLREENAP